MTVKTIPQKDRSAPGEQAKLRLVDRSSRSPQLDSRPPGNELSARQFAVRAEITARLLESEHPTALAVAAVCADGALQLSLISVDPEQASLLAEGLDRLTSQLRHHALSTRGSPARVDGFGTTSVLIALAFMGLTYFNDVAWIDAALSLTAQMLSAWMSRKDIRRR